MKLAMSFYPDQISKRDKNCKQKKKDKIVILIKIIQVSKIILKKYKHE